MLTKKQASEITRRMDRVANYVEARYAEMGFTREAAFEFCMELDRISDYTEKRAEASPEGGHVEYDMTEQRQRKDPDLHRQSDEPYMETFNAPSGVIERNQDEPFMDHYQDSDADGVHDYVQQDRRDSRNPVMASGGNWYDNERTASTQSGNWYDNGRTASEKGGNWYDRGE